MDDIDFIDTAGLSVASWVKHRIDGEGLNDTRQALLWSIMARAGELLAENAETNGYVGHLMRQNALGEVTA